MSKKNKSRRKKDRKVKSLGNNWNENYLILNDFSF